MGEITGVGRVHAESGNVGIDVVVSDLRHVHGTLSSLGH